MLFLIKDKYVFSGVKNVIDLGEKYGSSTIGNRKKVNIEFVSANPTGILHIGHGRGATYGDNDGTQRKCSFLGERKVKGVEAGHLE